MYLGINWINIPGISELLEPIEEGKAAESLSNTITQIPSETSIIYIYHNLLPRMKCTTRVWSFWRETINFDDREIVKIYDTPK